MKILIRCILLSCLVSFLCSCQFYSMGTINVNVSKIAIKDQDTIILSVYYKSFNRVPGPLGDLTEEAEGYHRLIEKNINNNEQMLTGEKDLNDSKGIICRNNVICVSGYIFLDASSYNVISEYKLPDFYRFYDFKSDLKKILYYGGEFSEFDLETMTAEPLFDNGVLDAKYCPGDETTIAYVGSSDTVDNMNGYLYIMDVEGTGIINILGGYNIELISWNPDGNTIVFLNGDGIWNIEKDGTNLIKVSDFKLPSNRHYYSDVSLSYNIAAYKDQFDNIIWEKF